MNFAELVLIFSKDKHYSLADLSDHTENACTVSVKSYLRGYLYHWAP